jgi:hypothetical protein
MLVANGGGSLLATPACAKPFADHIVSFGEFVDDWQHAAANDMMVRPQQVAFDPQGRILVSGGFALVDAPEGEPVIEDYVYLHRYSRDGVLEEIIYSSTDPVNRGAMAVFIARAIAGGEAAIPAPPLSPTFADVKENGRWGWCYQHVEYLAAREIVRGYADGLHRPYATCNRGQMAVYVARAFELPI